MQKRFKAKAQKIVNELRAFLLKKYDVIPIGQEIKLKLLEDVMIDFYNANSLVEQHGYLMPFNKGTSICNNPSLKLKYESIKQIRKLLSELIQKDDGQENAEAFINNLISD